MGKRDPSLINETNVKFDIASLQHRKLSGRLWLWPLPIGFQQWSNHHKSALLCYNSPLHSPFLTDDFMLPSLILPARPLSPCAFTVRHYAGYSMQSTTEASWLPSDPHFDTLFDGHGIWTDTDHICFFLFQAKLIFSFFFWVNSKNSAHFPKSKKTCPFPFFICYPAERCSTQLCVPQIEQQRAESMTNEIDGPWRTGHEGLHLQLLLLTNVFSTCLVPFPLPPGQGAEQTRGGPAAHPEPVWNLFKRQQERQRQPTRPICGFVSGERLAAPAEWNQHTKRWWCGRRRCTHTLGTRYPPSAFAGRRDQKSQEKEEGAGQWKDQGLARIIKK